MEEQIEDLIQEWSDQIYSREANRSDLKDFPVPIAKLDGVILGMQRCIEDLQKMLNENTKP